VSVGDETLFTRNMADCIAIATFDRETGQRTMTHLSGRIANDVYYERMAGLISPKTTVIVACGFNGGQEFFEEDEVPPIREKLENAMKQAGHPINELEWLTLWSPANPPGLVGGTLVLQADGQYGRIARS
jgi:hypothetical protein